MRIKLNITSIFLLVYILVSCKLHENTNIAKNNTTEEIEKPDYFVIPVISSSKKESTNFDVLAIKQQGASFLDITVMPKVGCQTYSYELISLPISAQSTKIELLLQLIQNCSEETSVIKKKNIIRIDISSLLPKSTKEKTLQISFTSSSEKFNFNLVQ